MYLRRDSFGAAPFHPIESKFSDEQMRYPVEKARTQSGESYLLTRVTAGFLFQRTP